MNYAGNRRRLFHRAVDLSPNVDSGFFSDTSWFYVLNGCLPKTLIQVFKLLIVSLFPNHTLSQEPQRTTTLVALQNSQIEAFRGPYGVFNKVFRCYTKYNASLKSTSPCLNSWRMKVVLMECDTYWHHLYKNVLLGTLQLQQFSLTLINNRLVTIPP